MDFSTATYWYICYGMVNSCICVATKTMIWYHKPRNVFGQGWMKEWFTIYNNIVALIRVRSKIWHASPGSSVHPGQKSVCVNCIYTHAKCSGDFCVSSPQCSEKVWCYLRLLMHWTVKLCISCGHGDMISSWVRDKTDTFEKGLKKCIKSSFFQEICGTLCLGGKKNMTPEV